LRIALVSALRIHPVRSGGQSRTSALAAALAAAGHTVELHALIARKADYLSLRPGATRTVAPRLTETVHGALLAGGVGLLAYRAGLPPLWALAAARPPLAPRALTAALAAADVVIADFPFVYPVLRAAKRPAVRVLSTHNVEHALAPPRLARAVRAVETRAARAADLVVACTDDDAAFFRRAAADAEVLVVANALDAAGFARDAAAREATRRALGLAPTARALLFSASAYGPNAEGLAFLEALSARHGAWLEAQGLVFLVVGSVARAPRRAPGLIVAGPVDDPAPYFSAADGAVNPIFRGGGSSVKVAQAIAAGLPLVTTAIGARGYALRHGVEAEEFADERSLLEVLAAPRTPQERSAMAELARAANRARVDMREAIRPFLDALARRVAAVGAS
jgi:glycosyltransferase involved in cell wall biosynthesis